MIHVPIAVRVFTELADHGSPSAGPARKSRPVRPRRALVFDVETRVDQGQHLTFGSYRYCRVNWKGAIPTLALLEEGIFHDDALVHSDPEGFEILSSHASDGGIRLMTRSAFNKEVFDKVAYRSRALVIGYNLPFDLSRIAVGWGAARTAFHRGFSFVLHRFLGRDGKTREDFYRPRVCIKTIDSKRHLMGFAKQARRSADDLIPDDGSSAPDARFVHRGHFLDLHTLVFALTDKNLSLAKACEVFGVEHPKAKAERHGEITSRYIDYNRRDVLATAALFEKAMAEYAMHPIELQASKVFSPATIGKGYLRAMGVLPILERQPDFPKGILAAAMNAFYGGRAECRIRRTVVPVVYTDFLSMYPTVNALMGLWPFITAERIEAVDDTEGVRRLVEEITLDDCFNPETWKQFPALIHVPPEGDTLPIRADYEQRGEWHIGINPLTSEWPMWYALPDIVASKLLTGRSPRILRAFRLVPVGQQEGLRQVNLRGEVPVDPRSQDFFRIIIEERQRLKRGQPGNKPDGDRLDAFLKVLANSASYGILAEIVRKELGSKQEDIRVYGLDGTTFERKLSAVEEPGPFSFPPLAACTTAAARLMLAMLERCVSDLGAHYVFCDTDSMAIVATESGGLEPYASEAAPIRALAWRQVDDLVEKFSCLNPYDRGVVPGSILKIEEENYFEGRRQQVHCFSISAKRYALFVQEDGRLTLRKWSEHGLGHLLNPTDPDSEDRDWIRQIWEAMLVEELAMEPPALPWLDRPAVARMTASSPHVLRPFEGLNASLPYELQVKPFNFLLTVQVARFGHPEGYDPERFQLIAPFESDSGRWLDTDWTDRYSGNRFRIST